MKHDTEITRARQVDSKASRYWLDAWRETRAEMIAKYRATKRPGYREQYRYWALHYGRLVRRLEREVAQ